MSQDRKPRHEDEPCLCGQRIITTYGCTSCNWTIDAEGEYQWWEEGHGHYFSADDGNVSFKKALLHGKTHKTNAVIFPKKIVETI